MNLFLDRLHGDRIGFSVLGIFVIEKNTILTVMLSSHRPPDTTRQCCLCRVRRRELSLETVWQRLNS